MKFCAAALAMFLALSTFASTPASFRGKIIEFPTDKGGPAGMILVMGRNGAVRRVQVGSAHVVYAEEIPAGKREKQPSQSLKHGTEVRVEAVENGHGLWRARNIEILALPGMKVAEPQAELKPKSPKRDEKPATAPVLSKRG